MEMRRRGFLGLLAGAVLGKVIGPKLTAEPTSAIWEAAVGQPSTILAAEDTFVPLEVMANRILEVVNQEIKFLKMLQHTDEWRRESRIGDMTYVRVPEPFLPDLTCPPPIRLINRTRPVLIDQACYVDLPRDDLRHSWGQYSVRNIDPLAYRLAENMINTVRRKGGADFLVTVRGSTPIDATRVVHAHLPETGLTLRAMEYDRPVAIHGGVVHATHFDMLYGLG